VPTKKSKKEVTMADTDITGINVVMKSDSNNDSLSETQAPFSNDGFVRLNGILPTSAIADLHRFSQERFHRIFERLYQNGHSLFPTHYRLDADTGETEYALGLGVKYGFREIVMRSPGRYEISLLYSTAPDCLESLKQILSPVVFTLLEAKDWNELSICNLSLVISTPGSTEQSWHADGGHVNLQRHLPCHVMNIFVPLHDLTLAMGPTELRPGTHYHTRNLAPMMLAAACRKTLRRPVAPILATGDVLIFDYRVLHRGLANKTMQNRSFLVLTVAKPWFKDILNFPKRSLDDPATGNDDADAEDGATANTNDI
jgi:hypothetical protein